MSIENGRSRNVAELSQLPRYVRSRKRQEHGAEPISAFQGSVFHWNAVLEFPDLGQLADLETDREAIRRQIKDRVAETLRNDVNDGAEFPHDLDDRGDVGSSVFKAEHGQQTDVDVADGKVSATQYVDMQAHLWHKEGDDPKAALGKAVGHISDVVADTILAEIDQLEAEEEAVF